MMLKAFLCCFPLLAALINATGLPAEGKTGTITVTVTEIRPEEGGSILVTLFQGKDNWMEMDRASARKIIPVSIDSITVDFDGIPHGDDYAVQVIHDKNENGRFDMRWFPFPKPKEGAGVSNNRLRRGPPEYEKARFSLSGEEKSLRIRIRYY